MHKFIAFILIVTAGTLYQVVAGRVSADMNPFAGTTMTYVVALIASFLLFVLTKKGDIVTEMKKVNIFSLILGFVICMYDLGFVLAYRYGFSLALLSPLTSVSIMIALALVGTLIFKEQISMMNVIGLVIAGIGVLMTIK